MPSPRPAWWSRWTTTCACRRRSPARAALFLVDEVGQFLANRSGGVFVGYPDPAGIIGEHLDTPSPGGTIVVTHLGVGLADVVFGDAILRAAEREGRGVLLSLRGSPYHPRMRHARRSPSCSWSAPCWPPRPCRQLRLAQASPAPCAAPAVGDPPVVAVPGGGSRE